MTATEGAPQGGASSTRKLGELALSILTHVVPPIELLVDRRLRRWYDMLDGVGIGRELRDTVRRHAGAVGIYKSTHVFTQLTARLAGEHSRLDTIENKGRSVFGLAGAMVSLIAVAAAIVERAQPRADWLKASIVVLACIGLFSLLSATLLAIRANSMGVRYYVDPEDLERIRAELPEDQQKAIDEQQLLTITALTYKDYMADATEQKLHLVAAALRSFRNGMISIVLAGGLRLLFGGLGP